jgi:hypothetical protein
MIMKLLMNLNMFTQKKSQTHISDANYKAADLKDIIKCISTIDDIEKNNLLKLLRKYEHFFDGTLGNFETSDVELNLNEDANPYTAKAFPVPKKYLDTLKHEIELRLAVLKRCSDSE